ncbi:MAG: hypothetical protein FWD75_08560 [Propionibacteriaceae bacterium]|nr:hypothetical protein [Propionibacteriaceae bacterium]
MTEITPGVHVQKDQVLADLIDYLKQMLGADVVDMLQVTGRTRVFTELQLNSIDLVRLSELIDEKYPVSEQLVGMFADRPLVTLARLTMSDIAEFICHALG